MATLPLAYLSVWRTSSAPALYRIGYELCKYYFPVVLEIHGRIALESDAEHAMSR